MRFAYDRPNLDELDTVAATPKGRASRVAGPKMPATGKGKHARCVLHEPMPRAEGIDGIAYACFDVMPDSEAIAERRAFVDAIDASAIAHRAVEESRRLAPEPTAEAIALVGRIGPDYVSRMLTDRERADLAPQRAAELAECGGGSVRCPFIDLGAAKRNDYATDYCAYNRTGFATDADMRAHFTYRHADAELPETIAA